MHPNKFFRKANDLQNIKFARERSFGTLAINAENGPLLSHIPFQLNEAGDSLEAHLVRSNPILKSIGAKGEDVDAVISVIGPDTYVSPDWYGIEDQVPTWNYIAVHLRGKLIRLPQDELPAILERLSNNFEQQLLSKPVWEMKKVEQSKLEKMQNMIVPVFLQISEINGTWKLAQNKPEEARLSAAQQIANSGIGSQIEEIAELMIKPPC